jgi:hypothetical protein
MFSQRKTSRRRFILEPGVSFPARKLLLSPQLVRPTRHHPPTTRPTLLGALREGLRWEEFVSLYGRLILGWARSDFGLQASDADNLFGGMYGNSEA